MENKKWGDYELLGILGKGSQGVVYKARQPLLDRLVAIKVLPAYLVSDESFVARFRREAQNIARLSHPNIVHVYDMSTHEGTYYYVMEYVEGEDLGNMMKRGVQFSWEQVIDIVKQVASALDAANEQNMVHRDIKPENILVTPKGQVKVADFGLAKITNVASNVTRDGMILGTVNYMSPEQARGGDCDIRSDLYSLGVVMFRLLTGRVPFQGENLHSIIYKHIHEPPPDPSEVNPSVPPALARVCLKLLRKNPAERYQTPRELIRTLDSLKGQSLATAVIEQEEMEKLALRDGKRPSVSPSEATVTMPTASAPGKRKAAMWVLAIFLFLCAAAGAWFYDTRYNDSKWLAAAGFLKHSLSPPPSPSVEKSASPAVSPTRAEPSAPAAVVSRTPTPPPVEAEVRFRLHPPESAVTVTANGKPIPVPPAVDGVVTLKLEPGAYHVLVRAPDRTDQEFDVVVAPDGKVRPDADITVKLLLTPEKKAEIELASELNELLERAGDDEYEKYVAFRAKAVLESEKYPENKALKTILARAENRVAALAGKFLRAAEDELKSIVASLDGMEPRQMGELDLTEVKELLKRSLRCKETPEAEKLAADVKRLENAADDLLTAVETARVALERNDAAGVGEAIARLEGFMKNYGDFPLAAALLSKARFSLDKLREKLSREQLFAAWLARLRAAVGAVEKAIEEGDFEKASDALQKAVALTAERPDTAEINPKILREAEAVIRKIKAELPPVIAKGLRNRPEVILAVLRELAGAFAGKDVKRIAAMCRGEAARQVSELAAFFSDECFGECTLELTPDAVRAADDSASAETWWHIILRIGTPAARSTIVEKVRLSLRLKYMEGGWRIVAFKVLEPKNEKAER